MSKKEDQIVSGIKEYLTLNTDWDEASGPPTDEDAYEYAMGNCGMGRNGQCSLAGTEHCDWDCPYSS